jgi:hypothetical protein
MFKGMPSGQYEVDNASARIVLSFDTTAIVSV